MKTLPAVREMIRAYQRSDSSYDGIFFLGVRTTGIFCKPSCRARKPRPENVAFFAGAEDALAAGFRPCKRCRPLAPSGTLPPWAERLLKEIELNPAGRLRDADLRRRGIDPARVRRSFRKNFGITFRHSRGHDAWAPPFNKHAHARKSMSSRPKTVTNR